MVLPFFFPAKLILRFAGPKGAQNLAGQMFSAWFQARLIDAEFGKMLPICQINSPQGRVAHSSSRRQSTFHLCALRNACRRLDAYLQSRSFALRNRRLRPSPNSQPALLRLSAITSQVFHAARFCRSITGKP